MTSHRDLGTDLADFDLLPQLRKLAVVVLLCLVSACASNYHAHGPVPTRAQVRQYAPPGPPEDPWGPHITAASKRYGMPEAWIREVMRQESGGQQYLDGTLITSAAGAMGLMQLMPRTYEELRQRYGLGDDPYYPRDNIFAGAAYMKELYDRYGAPGFLAAYNAGPRRADDFLSGRGGLPSETVAYMAAVAPRLRGSASSSGMLDRGVSADNLNRQSLAGTLSPVDTLMSNGRYPAPASVAIDPSVIALNKQSLADAMGRNPTLASHATQAQPAGTLTIGAKPTAENLNRQTLAAFSSPLPQVERAERVAALSTLGSPGEWGVQVGAFANASIASGVANDARAFARGTLDGASVVLGTAIRPDGGVLYRARLVGVSANAAHAACDALVQQHRPCEALPPERL
jgi:D-alanyl-D-alanine carboxypeptidase